MKKVRRPPLKPGTAAGAKIQPMVGRQALAVERTDGVGEVAGVIRATDPPGRDGRRRPARVVQPDPAQVPFLAGALIEVGRQSVRLIDRADLPLSPRRPRPRSTTTCSSATTRRFPARPRR